MLLLWVQELYKNAIPLVKHLIINLIDMGALEDIERINKEIEVKSKGDKELLKYVIQIGEISKQLNYA